ncbi:MMPL family transporter [Acetobacter orientalis]|uniref:MMPL family transporter n=1 Tax=Acetobacter orientalis TaxID=146474 RepID=UPI0039EC2F62
MSARKNPKRLASALLASALVAFIVFSSIPLRLDMAGFLPQGHNAATRFLLREVRGGVAASLITVGIEGAPETELARISHQMQDSLSQDSQFLLVLNGSFSLDDNPAMRDLLFDHRYQLAPDASVRDFSPRALAAGFEHVWDGLQSSAEPLVAAFALRDPTGAFFDVMRHLQPAVHATLKQGVWFASDRNRALMLLRTRAAGMDLAAQRLTQNAIQAAFAKAQPGQARLLVSGPAVFAVQSAHSMRHDIEMMSAFSTVLVVVVLYWRFRSLWVLAAIGVPFLLSLSVAMVVVRLCFGYVHGIAFGFGMTMLGVSLDYPVLLIGHRDAGEGPQATLHRIGPSLRLAVTTAVLGLTGMVLCGLPGLVQLGVFSAVGLLSAACVTLGVMPSLIVAADLAPSVSGPSAPLARAEQWRRWRWLCVLPVMGAIAVLVWRPLVAEKDLTALSPIPASARSLDMALRHELGVPDSSHVIIVHAQSAQAVLQREEALHGLFTTLAQKGALVGVEDAAHILPSVALQQTRTQALPEGAILAARVAQQQAGLPFKKEAFDQFVADVAKARAMPALTPPDLAGTPLEMALAPLLFQRPDGWWGMVLPEAVTDFGAIQVALAGQLDVMALDLNHEVNALTAHHTALTLKWMAVGIGLAFVVLVVGLRDLQRLARVLCAVGAAMVVLLALLALRGVPVSLIHLVSIQFVLGIGLDYALFFARPQLDSAERARTMRTLLTCNVMTVLAFGLLGLCHTALLREIGITVACGAFLFMLFSFMLAGQYSPSAATDGA